MDGSPGCRPGRCDQRQPAHSAEIRRRNRLARDGTCSPGSAVAAHSRTISLGAAQDPLAERESPGHLGEGCPLLRSVPLCCDRCLSYSGSDLCDFLTWKATGSPSRSVCSTTCKVRFRKATFAAIKLICESGRTTGRTTAGTQARISHELAFVLPADLSSAFLEAVGLADLAADGFRRIGPAVSQLNACVGSLTADAAAHLGLTTDTKVATGIIGMSAACIRGPGNPLIGLDAHAGGLGLLGANLAAGASLEQRLAVIAGTSTCLMACSSAPLFIPGVWGQCVALNLKRSLPSANQIVPGICRQWYPACGCLRAASRPPVPCWITSSTLTPPRTLFAALTKAFFPLLTVRIVFVFLTLTSQTEPPCIVT